MNGFFESFAGGQFPLTVMLMGLVALFVFIIMMMYVPALTRRVFPKFGYVHYAQYIPFKTVYSDDSLELMDGALTRVWRVAGIDTGMQDEATREKFLDLRAQLFNQIRDSGVVFRFFMVRDAKPDNAVYEFGQPVLQAIYNKWHSQGLRIYENSYYVVMTVRGNAVRERLNQYSNLFESIFAPYRPTLLKNSSRDNMARFFGRILSPITKPEPMTCDADITSVATVDDVEFMPGGLVKYISGDLKMYAAMMSFKASPDYLDEDFYDAISTIQTEMVFMNAMITMDSSEMDVAMRQRRSTSESMDDTANQQLDEAVDAMDENISGTQSLVNYYPLFILCSPTEQDLMEKVKEFKKISAGFGISPVVENFASKVSWFAQIPGFDVFPRSFKMLSRTAVISIPLTATPRGVANSDWGPGPLVVFPTAQGTPYMFQFHVSDQPAAVAHTLTIGPTGGGKTTLFSFLIAQSLRYPRLKAFFFDRNKGAEVFTLSVGGKYITMQGRDKKKVENETQASFETHLNPLKMPDTAANRAFLRRWFSIITGQNDVASTDEIARAVSVNFDYLSEHDRMLKNLWESCFSSTGNMRPELKKWIDPTQYGYMFNEEYDTLDLQSRLTTFDFTDILQDEVLAPAVISYILHRINTTTVSGGNPSLIMIDETAPMLENKMFRDNFIAGLQEGRKNRQAYMTAFQRANILDKLGIGDVVRGQAQTVMFFRNPAADTKDYEHWNLNPLELAFIQGKAYTNLKRAVLLSRPVTGESVILNTELGGLGNLLRLFDSGRLSVLLAEELYKMYGTNFVGEYLKRQNNDV